MNIIKATEGTTLNLALEGRLDTTTAPQLEAELKGSMDSITELIWILKSWSICPPPV